MKHTLTLIVAALAVLVAGIAAKPAEPEGLWLKPAIRAELDRIPVHMSDKDEDPKARDQRLDTIAEDLAIAARGDRNKAAAGITLAEFEAHLARWVGDGCKGDPPKGAGNCDAGRSRSYWQMKEKACRPGWAHPRGSRAAQRAFAKCAVKRWQSSYNRCRTSNTDSPLAGAYSGYWGMCNGLKSATKRAWNHTNVLARLWQNCAGSESGKHCKP